MKTIQIWVTLFLAAVNCSAQQPPATSPPKPNIIFMLSDDQGWTETAVQMHPEVENSKSAIVETPHLVKLASQSMRFSQAYSPAPVCAPSRISLQTGKSPAQVRWTKASRSHTAVDGFKLIPPQSIRQIAREEFTIGELLQSCGYATAHYGKWHISGGGPEQHGYDESDGDTSNRDAAPHKGDNPVDIFGMGKRAAAFLKKQVEAGKPFFIQMSYNALHYPENARPDTMEKYRTKIRNGNDRLVGRAAIGENLDEGIGLLMETVDSLGIAGNTYVIHMSDNGGGGRGGNPLRGGKGDVWEGGIRVPLIIRGPGIAAGSWSHRAVVGYDLYNTFAEWAGYDEALPKTIEGGSITHLLNGQDRPVSRSREGLVFHFPHYQGDTPHSAILKGDYKLVYHYETETSQLFNLGEDLGERWDISSSKQDLCRQLEAELLQRLKALGADFPEVNPLFDPENPPAIQRGRGQRNRDARGNPRNRPDRQNR
ncbi:MAG: sulfatase-like hydrolase/transferase [Opitutae bacterium]|nr:sulfatase-like hydrolase/transferase [Opitutae bacterium]